MLPPFTVLFHPLAKSPIWGRNTILLFYSVGTPSDEEQKEIVMSLLHTSQPDSNATRQKQGNNSLSPPKCDSKFHSDVIAKLSLFLCVKSQALEERKCFL